MRLSRLVFFLVAMAPPVVTARDLGVQGHVYPILEPDIRAVMMDEIAQADLRPMQDEGMKSGRTYAKRLKQWNFYKATETSTRYFKPEFKVQRPIPVPQLNDGRWEWVNMGSKGQVINMRDYVTPHTAFLVIDARDEQQRQLAKSLLDEEPYRIVVTVSSGDPSELGAASGHAVFHLTDWISNFFQVDATPSLLYPAKGIHSREMGVTKFAPPYKAKAVMQAWDGDSK